MSEYVNPKLFRKLSEPITDEQADKNLEKFHEELKRLREECHIPNLVLICSVNIEDKESETGEKTVASTAMMGNVLTGQCWLLTCMVAFRKTGE